MKASQPPVFDPNKGERSGNEKMDIEQLYPHANE